MGTTLRHRQRGDVILGLVESTGGGTAAQACIVIYIAADGVAQYYAVTGTGGYLQAKIFIFIGLAVAHARIEGKQIGATAQGGILHKGKRATSMPLATYRLIAMQAVAAAREQQRTQQHQRYATRAF